MHIPAFEQAAQRLDASNARAAAVMADIREARMDEYLTALNRFDWSYEMADDGACYRRGRDALVALRALQAEVDPTGEIWMAQPGASRFAAPGPVVVKAQPTTTEQA